VREKENKTKTERSKRNDRTEKKIFNSTKGYPGEGPEQKREEEKNDYEFLFEEGDNDEEKQNKLDNLAKEWKVSSEFVKKDMETHKLVFGTEGEASKLTVVESGVVMNRHKIGWKRELDINMKGWPEAIAGKQKHTMVLVTTPKQMGDMIN